CIRSCSCIYECTRATPPAQEELPLEQKLSIPLQWRSQGEAPIPLYPGRDVSRGDTYVAYFKGGDGWSSARQDRRLSDEVLHNHICGFTIVGTYTTEPQGDTTKFLRIDLDAHGPEADPRANLLFANALAERLYQQGLKPLILDSNGKGGYWVEVHFSSPMPARVVRAYGRYLTRDYADYGIPDPEVFPKQDSVKGAFGNMVRLPGKHHKHKHWI